MDESMHHAQKKEFKVHADPMFMNIAALQTKLVLSVIAIFLFYLISFYLLLTTDNPFNFNNNYHLIAFLTVMIVIINITLFLLFAGNYQSITYGGFLN